MNEEMNQKISQFLDNDLGHDETLDLLQKLRTSPALAEKLNRYEAIGHALKTDQFLTLKPDFSAQISQRLEQEPIHFLPKKKTTNRRYQWLALAASVAVVSVVAVRSLPHLGNTATSQPPIQVAQQHPPTPAQPEQAVVAAKPAQSEIPLNERINEYLQAHNGSMYANNPNFKSMTRVTTYNQK